MRASPIRDFNVGRSASYAEDGMVATAHPRATLAGLDVLRKGGNAMDAAITAIAMLSVIEPQSTGIGGDCFVIYCPKSGAPIGLNGSGRAPAKANVGWYKDRGISKIEMKTPHAVTIPGAIDAWCKLAADHGTMPMSELLAPAIQAAEEGFILTPRVAHDWAGSVAKLSSDPDTKRSYLPNGRAPGVGEKHRSPELGATLRLIGEKGRAGFYEGRVAEDIVTKLKSLGGLHELSDFAAQEAEYVTPVQTRYRGYDVCEIPPNGQGLTALIILNVLAGYDLSEGAMSEADRIHLLAEAGKAAYWRRDTYFADQRFAEVPIERLLSTQEADSIRGRIRMDEAHPGVHYNGVEHKDTTYLCVVDKDRNAVSFINSLFAGFGSGITAPKSGVILQNRGMGFRIDDTHPSRIEGGKRPFHTIIPGMLMKDGKAVMPFGVMGGHYQSVGHANLVSNILDRGDDPQEAIERPRTFAYEGELQLEDPVAEDVRADLAARGHVIGSFDTPVGGAQAIWIDHERGVLIGGSEKRKDGCALGY
ncbi:gamma-glutamyltransferase [Allostella sp. ATCC 35155]|nr:gamma-glutamyltransferase [Stella sp. ATCC 35155]